MLFSSRAGYADAIAGSLPSVPQSSSPSPPPRNGSVTTRALSFSQGAGYTIERIPGSSSDDDIVMVSVKLSNKVRRQSYDDALPERPPKRSFLRRMSTRILPPADEDKWKAVKMPRREYRRHFLRDKEGNYAGLEPQRDWDEEDIKREYGMYQEMPVGSSI